MKNTAVITEIVRIGNSHGVRIPKAIREQARLSGRVAMMVSGGALVIRAARKPREGWDEAFSKAVGRGRDEAVWPQAMRNSFDETEWTW